MPPPIRRKARPSFIFWTTLAFTVLVAFTGGASRVDVQSLVVLKPAAVLASALALVTLRRSHVAAYKWLFIGVGAVFALSLAYLVPLPPALWHGLPGRDELAQVDAMLGLGSVWRPLTLTPTDSWHAITALFIPLAMLLLVVQLDREDRYRLLPVLIVLGGFSGLVGLLQIVGAGSSLYLYKGTNSGTAVGLFANRNHAALLLAAMFPMLAVWAGSGEHDRARRGLRMWAAGAAGAVLFPMILITGSRSGLLVSLVGVAGAFVMMYPFARQRSAHRSRRQLMGFVGIGIAGMALLAWLALSLSKAEAIMRLLNTSRDNEFRVDIWAVSVDLLWKYFPIGSGVGSFPDVYQVIEPAYQLNPFYRNHAHQDFIEIAITLGLPGVVILLVAATRFMQRSVALWVRRDGDTHPVRMARMAGIVIAMTALASLGDYPLRTPTLMCVFVLLSIWFLEPDLESRTPSPRATGTHDRGLKGRDDKSSKSFKGT